MPKTAFFRCSAFLKSYSKFHEFWRTDTFCDVTFFVEGKQFKAHKMLLAAHSPVFLAMFSTPMVESSSGRVFINDIEATIFGKFLHFLYTGAGPATNVADTVKLYYCADKYDVSTLRSACENCLCDIVNIENVMEVLPIAQELEMGRLEKRVGEVMGGYLRTAVASKGWYLVEEDPERIKSIIHALLKTQVRNPCCGSPSHYGGKLYAVLRRYDCVTMVFSEIKSVNFKHLHPQELRFKMRPRARRYVHGDQQINRDWEGFLEFIEDRSDDNRRILALRFLKYTEKVEFHVCFKATVTVRNTFSEGADLDCQCTTVHWTNDSVHPTMGLPRLIIYKEDEVRLPRDADLDYTVYISCSWVEEELEAVGEQYAFDNGQQEIENPSDFVELVHIWGDDPQYSPIPLEMLGDRTRTLFTDQQRMFQVPGAPMVTLQRLIRYMYMKRQPGGGALPRRNEVDIHMLKAACRLRMDYSLIMYLEHALVWDLDPANCLEYIEAGTELGLGFLKHAAVQYFKIHFERIIRQQPENWRQVKPSVLMEILVDMYARNIPPEKKNYLPQFLITRRK